MSMSINSNNLINSKKYISWLVVCVFIGMQLFSFEIAAATSKNINFNQLIKKADVIVFGKCTAVGSEWRKNKIYSYATIQVSNNIKGDVSSEIQVEYLGGTALHPNLKVPVSMNVSNGIKFVEGEETVLMLRQLANSRYQVVGVQRGKISIITDGLSGEKIIQSGMKRIESKPSTKGNAIVLTKRQMTLQEFKEFIQSRMKIEKKRSE